MQDAGERFDKLRTDSSEADVAQLVEQPIRNRQVTSSTLVVGSRFCQGRLRAPRDLGRFCFAPISIRREKFGGDKVGTHPLIRKERE